MTTIVSQELVKETVEQFIDEYFDPLVLDEYEKEYKKFIKKKIKEMKLSKSESDTIYKLMSRMYNGLIHEEAVLAKFKLTEEFSGLNIKDFISTIMAVSLLIESDREFYINDVINKAQSVLYLISEEYKE